MQYSSSDSSVAMDVESDVQWLESAERTHIDRVGMETSDIWEWECDVGPGIGENGNGIPMGTIHGNTREWEQYKSQSLTV